MLFPGLTLVISPLISLMKDQVGALVEAGVPAACINSAMSAEEFRDALYFAGRGQYKLLYVAPERLTAPSFLEFAKRVPISMVTVDEAHCISQWGQDFRPSYLKILDFLAELPERPLVSAFTATATAEVRDDIVQALGLHEPFIKTTGFDRPNLYFAVEQPTSKGMKLLQLLNERKDKSGWDKSAIFHKATIRPFREVNHADTAEDALHICLNRKLRVDLSYMSFLTGERTARAGDRAGRPHLSQSAEIL